MSLARAVVRHSTMVQHMGEEGTYVPGVVHTLGRHGAGPYSSVVPPTSVVPPLVQDHLLVQHHQHIPNLLLSLTSAHRVVIPAMVFRHMLPLVGF